MEVTTDAQASVAAWLTTQADAPATLADVTVQHVGKSLWRICFSFGDTMSPGALILTVEATRGATETRTTRILVLQPLTGQAIRGRSALQLAYQVANTMMSCNKNFFEVVTTMQSMIKGKNANGFTVIAYASPAFMHLDALCGQASHAMRQVVIPAMLRQDVIAQRGVAAFAASMVGAATYCHLMNESFSFRIDAGKQPYSRQIDQAIARWRRESKTGIAAFALVLVAAAI